MKQPKHEERPALAVGETSEQSLFLVRFRKYKFEQYSISASWYLLKGCWFRQKLTFSTANCRLLPSSVGRRDFSSAKHLQGNVSGEGEVYYLIVCMNWISFPHNQ